jgi:hypothetical protein
MKITVSPLRIGIAVVLTVSALLVIAAIVTSDSLDLSARLGWIALLVLVYGLSTVACFSDIDLPA